MYVAALALELSSKSGEQKPLLLPFAKCSLCLSPPSLTDSNELPKCTKLVMYQCNFKIECKSVQFEIEQCVHFSFGESSVSYSTQLYNTRVWRISLRVYCFGVTGPGHSCSSY